MDTFFQPYEGKRPYVFISYSHRDSGQVLNILTVLDGKKLRLWYDEGIPAGSDWPRSIEQHMRECSAVVFFLSSTALASPNCRLEIQTARRLKKPLLVVPLDDSGPDVQWAGLLEKAPRSEADPAAILSWKVLSRSFYRKRSDSFTYEWIGLSIASALVIGAGLFLAGLMLGRFDPKPPAQAEAVPLPTAVPTASPSPIPSPSPSPGPTETPVPTPTVDPGNFPVSFPDAQQENAIRMILGRPEGKILRPDLADVTELYFCGSMTLTSPAGIAFGPDGTARVNGAPVIRGKVSDLSVIRIMAFLKKLALIDQPLGGVPSVYGLVLLEELYLSGSDVTSLTGLGDLPSLKTLHIEHTDVKDLSRLLSFPSLDTVTVSADMLPLSFPDDRQFRVILVP